jgi:hypothetical protein
MAIAGLCAALAYSEPVPADGAAHSLMALFFFAGGGVGLAYGYNETENEA